MRGRQGDNEKGGRNRDRFKGNRKKEVKKNYLCLRLIFCFLHDDAAANSRSNTALMDSHHLKDFLPLIIYYLQGIYMYKLTDDLTDSI